MWVGGAGSFGLREVQILLQVQVLVQVQMLVRVQVLVQEQKLQPWVQKQAQVLAQVLDSGVLLADGLREPWWPKQP
jgi:hypothetical protein